MRPVDNSVWPEGHSCRREIFLFCFNSFPASRAFFTGANVWYWKLYGGHGAEMSVHVFTAAADHLHLGLRGFSRLLLGVQKETTAKIQIPHNLASVWQQPPSNMWNSSESHYIRGYTALASPPPASSELCSVSWLRYRTQAGAISINRRLSPPP